MEAMPRAYLESLTTSDLIRMADNLGIDIPPDLDRIFIIEELLEIASLDETAEDAADPKLRTEASQPADVKHEANMDDSGLAETVALPRHYNITFIEVMIRDPLWAFVFWEIKDQDKDHFEKAQEFEGYYLKVSPWITSGKSAAPSPAGAETEGVFKVQVSSGDTAWYLGLNPAAEQGYSLHNEVQYKVELCVSLKGNEAVLAVSSPFRLPPLHGAARCAEENPLVRLSGYGDFHILRNNERMFRIKKGSAAGSYE